MDKSYLGGRVILGEVSVMNGSDVRELEISLGWEEEVIFE